MPESWTPMGRPLCSSEAKGTWLLPPSPSCPPVHLPLSQKAQVSLGVFILAAENTIFFFSHTHLEMICIKPQGNRQVKNSLQLLAALLSIMVSNIATLFVKQGITHWADQSPAGRGKCVTSRGTRKMTRVSPPAPFPACLWKCSKGKGRREILLMEKVNVIWYWASEY